MARKTKKEKETQQEEPTVDSNELGMEEPVYQDAEEPTLLPETEENLAPYDDLKKKLLDEYQAQRGAPVEEQETTPEYSDEPESTPEYSDETLEQENVDNYSTENYQQEQPEPIEENLGVEAISSEDLGRSAAGLQSDLDMASKHTAPDVDQGFSKVAVSKKSSMAMLLVLVLVLSFIIYKVLKPATKQVTTVSEFDQSSPLTKSTADTGPTIIMPEVPALPAAPTLVAPAPPPPPAPPVVADLNMTAPPSFVAPTVPAIVTTLGSTETFEKKDQAAEARRKARLASSMITGGSGGSPNASTVAQNGQSLSILKRNNDQIVATNIGDLRRVIAQGKVIDAILETAINTDLPGSVRAIVSMDIYSESGKNILIPKGARLIGQYSSNVTFGINRVKIMWTRLIRPDGVDIAIASPGTDQLGRSGTSGDLDNHLMNSLTAAAMSSIIDIALAQYSDKQTNTAQTQSTVQPSTGVAQNTGTNSQTSATPTVNTGSTVTQGTTSLTTQAYTTATQNVGGIGKDYLQKTSNMQPTITVDQGTALKVFVNKDLVFPGKSANLTTVIE